MSDQRQAVVTLRLPVKLPDEAKARAEREERSLSALLRVALRMYLGHDLPYTA